MQTQNIQKVVTEIKNDTPANKTNFLVALAILGVLLLGIQQKSRVQEIQVRNSEQATVSYQIINTPKEYTLEHPPAPGPNEE
jgi:hypothetical protein